MAPLLQPESSACHESRFNQRDVHVHYLPQTGPAHPVRDQVLDRVLRDVDRRLHFEPGHPIAAAVEPTVRDLYDGGHPVRESALGDLQGALLLLLYVITSCKSCSINTP